MLGRRRNVITICSRSVAVSTVGARPRPRLPFAFGRLAAAFALTEKGQDRELHPRPHLGDLSLQLHVEGAQPFDLGRRDLYPLAWSATWPWHEAVQRRLQGLPAQVGKLGRAELELLVGLIHQHLPVQR